jgi:hypothetical protein
MKILESSQTLLHVLKKEDSTLNKRKMNVSTRKGANNKENVFNSGVASAASQGTPELKRTARGSSANKYQ